MTQDAADRARRTFFSLRFGMIVMVAMLLISVVLQIVVTDDMCRLNSISAYYYTPVKSMFVGALCAIGVSLMAYQGRMDTENVLLDYSGFLAFIVAYVPTGFEKGCSAQDASTSAGVVNNVFPLLAAGLVVTILACVRWWKRNGGSQPDVKANVVLGAVLVITVGLVAFGWLTFVYDYELFRAKAHGIAAYALFGGIFFVVVANARRRAGSWSPAKLIKFLYFWIAVVMLVTVAIFLYFYLGRDVKQAVFWVEAAMISEFAVFWSAQTHEFWHEDVS
jgi:hypothetical protein